MELADPPVLESLLLEQPWPMVIALAAVAAGMWIVAGRRRRPRLRYASLGAAAAAVGVIALAAAVTTEREQILARTGELVAAAQSPLDLAAIDALIDPAATLVGPDGSPWLQFDALRLTLQGAVQRFDVDGQTVRHVEAEVDGQGRGRSVLSLRTDLGELGRSVPSLWALDWHRGGDGQWRVVMIHWLEFQGRPPAEGVWRF